MQTRYTFNKTALRLGFRSGLEQQHATELNTAQVNYLYEDKENRIAYSKPVTKHTYLPDFSFPGTNIVIESKGLFDTASRKKHLLIQQQHPDLDVRFVFSNMNQRIGKKSKTTYAMWCEKNGFQYADKHIPQAWIEEIKNESTAD